MQAVEKQMPTVTSQRFIRVMAGFGLIAAAILIVVVVVSSAILVAGSVGSQPAIQATVTDPLAAPGLAAFRASEHEVTTPWTGDALAAPSLVQFRQSEHAEAD